MRRRLRPTTRTVKARSRRPLRGYLVPLRDESGRTRCYLLALAQWLGEEEATTRVGDIITSFGATWPGDEEVFRLDLSSKIRSQLPKKLPLLNLILAHNWAGHNPLRSFAEVVRSNLPDRGLLGSESYLIVRRRGSRSSSLTGRPIWLDDASLLCADLDAERLSVASMTVRSVLGDFGEAFPISLAKRAAIEGWAQEFLDEHGSPKRLLSAEETRQRVETERFAAIARLAKRFPNPPVYQKRWEEISEPVRRELSDRARLHRTRAGEEWKRALQASIAATGGAVGEWLRRAYEVITEHPEDPFGAAKGFLARGDLRRMVLRKLNAC